MTTSGEELEPGTWGYRLRLALAPMCMLLVAGFHFFRVHCCDQTPWKGGGFGMFSTVDTREARFLKVFLLVDGREIPVVPPKWLEKRGEEVSAAPSEAAVADFAERMAKLDWLDREGRWKQIAGRASGAASSHVYGAELLAPPALSADAKRPLPQFEPGPRPDIEAARPAEAAREAAYRVDFRAVRVELWRYRFDAGTSLLSGTKTIAVERPRTSGKPTIPSNTEAGEVAHAKSK